MSTTKQLLHSYIDHIGVGHSTHSSSRSNLGSGQSKDSSSIGGHAQVDGQYQELFGLQRDFAQGKPSLYPILWYVSI